VSLHRRGRPNWATESIERDARPTFHSKTARRLQNLEVTIMTHSPDTGHGRITAGTSYADEFALLADDGPTLEELSLHGDLADQADQIRELRSKLAKAKAERDTARSGSRELAAENATLRGALARVVDLVMQGADDPVSAALDVLEDAGIGVFAPVADDSSSRRLLAVAA
jgi:hypothetical protein